MADDLRITVDDWRAEMERVMGCSDDAGMTASELAKKMGLSARTMLLKLRAIADAGRLGVGKRRITTLDGRPTTCPVYWIKPAPKAGTGSKGSKPTRRNNGRTS